MSRRSKISDFYQLNDKNQKLLQERLKKPTRDQRYRKGYDVTRKFK